MTLTWLVIYVLFVHYIADFVLQTNWMALNKSKSNLALGAHILTYSVAMFLGLLIFFPVLPVLAFVAINSAAHFLTDYVTSRMNAYFWVNEKRSYFWWTIGFDQWVHAATLVLLLNWLLLPQLAA